jgi:hypothetical protein
MNKARRAGNVQIPALLGYPLFEDEVGPLYRAILELHHELLIGRYSSAAVFLRFGY